MFTRGFLLVLATALVLNGQPSVTHVRLYPQLKVIGSLQEHVISICNQGTEQMNVHAAQAWAAAAALGLQPATHSNILAESRRVNRMSWQRKVLLGAEVIGLGFTVADQVGLFKIGNPDSLARWKAAIPLTVAASRSITTWIKARPPVVGPLDQDRLLPVFFSIPPKRCVEYLMYGTMRPEGGSE